VTAGTNFLQNIKGFRPQIRLRPLRSSSANGDGEGTILNFYVDDAFRRPAAKYNFGAKNINKKLRPTLELR